jgi:hypothetical protein
MFAFLTGVKHGLSLSAGKSFILFEYRVLRKIYKPEMEEVTSC